jgi:uncharacterized protein involved in exopolysaccharide biosynthesis
VQLASRAGLPAEPVSGRKLLSVILGGILGLIVGVIAAFVVDKRQASVVKAAASTASA